MIEGYKDLEDRGDMTLMRDISVGNIEAYAELLDRYLPLISRTTFRILCDRRDSEEVTKTVFIYLWNNSLLYDDRFTIEEWLMRKTYQFIRRRMVGRLFGKRPDLFAVSKPKVEDIDDYTTTQAWELFCRASVKMNAVQRTVFTFTELELLTIEKTAFITGLFRSRIIFAGRLARGKVLDELAKFNKEDEYDLYVRFIRNVSDGLTDISQMKKSILHELMPTHQF